MTQHEAFSKYLTSRQHNGLPWEAATDELRACFDAGWAAHKEALRQADLFPGTLSDDLCPVKLTGSNCLPCSEDNLVRAQDRADSSGVTAEDIYAAYPRKIGKQAALKAIKKACGTGAVGQMKAVTILGKVKEYAAAVAQWPAADKQYCPHPATWFNRGSYDDDPSEWLRGTPAATSQFSRQYK